MMAMTIAVTATRTRMKTMPAEAVMRLGGGSFGWFMPASFAAPVPGGGEGAVKQLEEKREERQTPRPPAVAQASARRHERRVRGLDGKGFERQCRSRTKVRDFVIFGRHSIGGCRRGNNPHVRNCHHAIAQASRRKVKVAEGGAALFACSA